MELLAVDTETTGLDTFHGCRPFMVTMCNGRKNYSWTGEVDPYDRASVTWEDDDLDEIQTYLDEAETLIFHNTKFDVRMLSSIGVDAKQWGKIEDTLIASHVCCSGEKHGLKPLAFKYLGYDNKDQKLLKQAVIKARRENPKYDLAREGHPTMPGEGGPGTSWASMDYWLCIEECRKYGLDDVEMTWLLWKMYEDVINDLNLWEQYEHRKALLPITYKMCSVGMNLYEDKVHAYLDKFHTQREQLAKEIKEEHHIASELDLDKEKDLGYLLFQVLGLEVNARSDKTGKPLMNKNVIQDYIDEGTSESEAAGSSLQKLQDYRLAGTKIGYLNSYLKWTDDNSRVHSNLLITGTRETRQASRDPNTQNIDKALRDIFGPPPGKVWLIYDLVNIELRIWGYEVGNAEMVEIFDNNRSFHMEIAKTIYPDLVKRCEDEGEVFKEVYPLLYGWVKNGNFSIIYGGGENKANKTYKAQQGYSVAGFPQDKPINAYRRIIKRFPEVPTFTAEKIHEVFENDLRYGYPFITCLGGYRLDVNINQVYTTACNYFCQGSAGYIIGLAMEEVAANPLYKSSGAQMVNQVHDSLYIEVDEDANTPTLQQSLQRSIEKGGECLLPTCAAELEKIIHYEP